MRADPSRDYVMLWQGHISITQQIYEDPEEANRKSAEERIEKERAELKRLRSHLVGHFGCPRHNEPKYSRFLEKLPYGCYAGREFWAAYMISTLRARLRMLRIRYNVSDAELSAYAMRYVEHKKLKYEKQIEDSLICRCRNGWDCALRTLRGCFDPKRWSLWDYFKDR